MFLHQLTSEFEVLGTIHRKKGFGGLYFKREILGRSNISRLRVICCLLLTAFGVIQTFMTNSSKNIDESRSECVTFIFSIINGLLDWDDSVRVGFDSFVSQTHGEVPKENI